MKKIKWDESVSVGHPRLDEHRKFFIHLLNKMEEHQNDLVSSEAISQLIYQMREFATYYFALEEECLRKAHYDDFDSHKDQHRKFKEKTASFCVDIMNHKASAPREIYRHLTDWFAEHIVVTDSRIKPWLQIKADAAVSHP
ncbi:MAG: hemerythrin family protein [Planctomycetaceae bacterium]|nr:hemerythrin family protein [Planctomycetaceae bacterium]